MIIRGGARAMLIWAVYTYHAGVSIMHFSPDTIPPPRGDAKRKCGNSLNLSLINSFAVYMLSFYINWGEILRGIKSVGIRALRNWALERALRAQIRGSCLENYGLRDSRINVTK